MKDGLQPCGAHALDTLTAFFAASLSKKYTNPSSDIINLLAGLDAVDSLFTTFVTTLDTLIKSHHSLLIRQKAITCALSLVSGAYQTSLLSYFSHRDLFPSLMKIIQESESVSAAFEPFTLLGLLANYNKFEFQNPYRLRLEDFVNESTIQKIIRSVGATSAQLRDGYTAIQDDFPEGWTLTSTFGMLGLGKLVGSKPKQPVLDPEVAKEQFKMLPGSDAAVLLATYDFAHANKLFCFNLTNLKEEKKDQEAPIVSFLSLTSYLLSHAHLSPRTGLYARLNLITLRLLLEDQVLCKRLCADESKTFVRLCRQRSPYLPLIRSEKVLVCSILDGMIDGINHNLRRRLDVDLYILFIALIHRVVSYVARSRTRLEYHWSELFRSLLTLTRFLAQYSTDLQNLLEIETLLDSLTNVIALSLSSGESFLPSPAAYDDLFYKLVECGETLQKFSDAYSLSKRKFNSISTLLSVSKHYNDMLKDGTKGSQVKHLTSAQVAKVIRDGYETLNLDADMDELGAWERYREKEEKTFLKKMARTVVADVRELVDAK